ncbi:MAG: glycosyltransferase [Bacteroidota bacterium]
MKISIVTEGFQSTGYGHITRCLSLYQAFEERNIFPTLYINGDEASKLFAPDTQLKIIDWIKYPTKLAGEIKNSDVLIIDSYIGGIDHYNNFSRLSKISLFLDDNLRMDYPNGIILNGTINAEILPYKKEAGKEYLLGAKFIPIRKEFWNQPHRKINQDISSILITYGGQDVKDLTLPTLKTLEEIFPRIKVNVVLGNNKNLEDKISKSANVTVWHSIDAKQMMELMLNSDIAISAAGQTLYELAVTGTPTIAIAVADNQKNNILGWKKKGFLIDPIFYNDINLLRKIIGQINILSSVKIRKKLSYAGESNINGQGARSIISLLLLKF